jgi:hypothetical protein
MLVVLASARDEAARARTRAVVGVGALLVAAAQIGVLAVLGAAFADAAGWPIAALLESRAGAGGLIRIAAAIAAAWAVRSLQRSPDSRARQAVLLGTTAVLP